MASSLAFRSLIHFIFVCGFRKCSSFNLLHVALQFSLYHLLKKLSFPHCIFLPSLLEINWLNVCGLNFGLPSVPLIYVSVSVSVPYCFDYYGFVAYSLKSRSMIPSVLFFLWLFGVFCRASQVALVVKNLPANVGDVRDAGSIPGLVRSLGGKHSYPLQYPCLENPCTKETGGLQSIRLWRVRHNWSNLAQHTHMISCRF